MPTSMLAVAGGLTDHVRRTLRRAATAMPRREAEQKQPNPLPVPKPEVPESWRGAAPVPLAPPGPRMAWTAHQYAQLLASYYLVAGVPQALWQLVDCHRRWWPNEEQQPEPVLLVPRIRAMCAAYPTALPPWFELEVGQTLLDLAKAAEPFRPDWAERLRHFDREFQAARRRKTDAP